MVFNYRNGMKKKKEKNDKRQEGLKLLKPEVRYGFTRRCDLEL